MYRKISFTVICCCFAVLSFSQGSAFGLKGGLTIGTQKWNSFERDPLIAYHGAVYIETLDIEDEFALVAQLGYHQKGSALRNQNFFNPISGNQGRLPAQTFEFNNLSLIAGVKKKNGLGVFSKWYYLIGLRGDYTLSNNLDAYEEINSGFYPFPAFVQNFNFGLTVGGGIEWMFSDLVGGVIEFTVNPDLTAQYRQPELRNVLDQFGNERTIGERVIRNLTFEVTIGIRLLRIVEYVD